MPIPAVIVAATDAPELKKALSAGQQVTLISTDYTASNVQANNVLAKLRSGEPGAPWVVVTTPSSCWFSTAGERGSGVALFLALARWAGSEARHYNYLFMANSGHELDFMGAHYSMNEAPKPERVKFWLHLGASIAARQWQQTNNGLRPLPIVHKHNMLYGDKTLLNNIQQAFTVVPNLNIVPTEQLRRETSELGVIVARGYTGMGMVGAHRYFHTPLDLPNVTSPKLLEPYGKAFEQLFETLEKQ